MSISKMEQLLQKYKAQKPNSEKPTSSPQRPVSQHRVPTIPVPVPGPPCATLGAEPPFEVKYITDPNEARSAIETEFASDSIIGIDIETMKAPQCKTNANAGLSPHLSAIRLVQLCQKPEVVFVFDVVKTGMEPLMPVFSQSLVAHNAVFEMAHFFHAGIEIPQADCTMLMSNTLFGGLPSLKDLAKRMLRIDISKEEQTSDWGHEELSQEQIRYAAMDAWLVQQIYPLLVDKIIAQRKQEVYRLLQEAQFPVMKMMYNGCHFNATAHYRLTEQNKADLTNAEARLKQAVGTGVKLSSGKQLSNHYKKTLDKRTLANWERTERGDLCLDQVTVKKFSYIEAVAPLAKFKGLSTQVSKFGQSLMTHINPATGRLHADYRIAGAKTSRFSCSNPPLQQIPKAKVYRNLFNAPIGRKIVVADYSQLELRVLALLSQDATMLEAYKNEEDLHRLTASSMTGVPPAEVTEEQRSAAKAVNFGIAYGMSASGLVTSAWSQYGVRMTQKQAAQNIKAFYAKFPGVKKWGNNAAGNAAIYGNSRTKTGRSIRITGSPNTQGRNYPIQGSAGEVLLSALAELDKALAASGLDIKLVNIIHDEIVLEVAEANAEPAARLLEKAMVDGMLRIFPEAETKKLVKAKIGNNWGEAK
jgi:DNA polymerase I